MSGDVVEQGGDPAQPPWHVRARGPAEPELLPHRLLQLDHPVGDVPYGVGDMEADRGGAHAQRGETVLLAEQGLRAQRRAGAGPGARSVRGQLAEQFGELAAQDVDPAGGAGGVLGGEA